MGMYTCIIIIIISFVGSSSFGKWFAICMGWWSVTAASAVASHCAADTIDNS